MLRTRSTELSAFSKLTTRLLIITRGKLKKKKSYKFTYQCHLQPQLFKLPLSQNSYTVPPSTTILLCFSFYYISQRKQNKGNTSFLPTHLSFTPLYTYSGRCFLIWFLFLLIYSIKDITHLLPILSLFFPFLIISSTFRHT